MAARPGSGRGGQNSRRGGSSHRVGRGLKCLWRGQGGGRRGAACRRMRHHIPTYPERQGQRPQGNAYPQPSVLPCAHTMFLRAPPVCTLSCIEPCRRVLKNNTAQGHILPPPRASGLRAV